VSLTERLLSHAGSFDDLAGRATLLGRVDARAKVLVTLAFVTTAASFGRQALFQPAPLLVYLAAIFALGDVPLGPVVARVAALSPFALLVGAADLLLHRSPAVTLGPVVLSEGTVSFISLAVRFLLCATAVFLLAATTRFCDVVRALRRMGMPRVLATQLLLAHRYLYVLAGEAGRMARAHSLRAAGTGGPGLRTGATLLTQLLLRSLSRAERVFAAMTCRGFDGDLSVQPPTRVRLADLGFLAGWCAFFLLVRSVDLPEALGRTLAP
jgi:cobalt/nickel transport system permease protein